MSSQPTETAPFRVGDRVTVPFGPRRLRGFIVEDRGRAGAGGRRLFRVRVPMEPSEPVSLEVPVEELQVDEAPADLNKSDILDYLKRGGLVAILLSNRSGGKNQPRVWLCADSYGHVTHTFTEELGQIGGRPVPFQALHENSKVFSPRKDEVISFLGGFDLTRREAESVVRSVGTSP
jgi:hypothetical protein